MLRTLTPRKARRAISLEIRRACGAIKSFSSFLTDFNMNSDYVITPFEESPRESLYIAPSFPLPRVVRQPSIFTSTMVVAEFHNQHFI